MSNYQQLVETVKRKGIAAYFSGDPPTACPYVTPGKQGAKYRRLWLGGYVEARDWGLCCDQCHVRLTLRTGYYRNGFDVLCTTCGLQASAALHDLEGHLV